MQDSFLAGRAEGFHLRYGLACRGSVPYRSASRMIFKTVFDVAQSGYTTWWFPASGLIFVCVGLLLVCGTGTDFEGHADKRAGSVGFLRTASVFAAPSKKVFDWGLSEHGNSMDIAGLHEHLRRIPNHARRAARRTVCNRRGPGYRLPDPIPNPGRSHESFVVGGRRFACPGMMLRLGFKIAVRAASRSMTVCTCA